MSEGPVLLMWTALIKVNPTTAGTLTVGSGGTGTLNITNRASGAVGAWPDRHTVGSDGCR